MNLNHSFLTEASLAKLKYAGISTVKQFLDTNEKVIQKHTELPANDIKIIKNYLQTMYEIYLPVSLEEHAEIIRCSIRDKRVYQTGIEEFDKRLNGIPQGSLIEVIGDPESGKSKLCMSICINILAKYNWDVFWIDTKMDFTSIGMEREMRSKFASEASMLQPMKKIHVERKFTLQGVIDTLEYLMKSERIQSGLLILDSLSSLLFSCVGKRYSIREESVKKIGDFLRNLCVKKKFTIIVTTIPKSERSSRKRQIDNSTSNGNKSILSEYASDCLLMRRKEKEQDTCSSTRRNIYVVKSFVDKNFLNFWVTLGDKGVI